MYNDNMNMTYSLSQITQSKGLDEKPVSSFAKETYFGLLILCVLFSFACEHLAASLTRSFVC